MDLKRITVHIGADISELKKGLNQAQKDLKKAFGADTLKLSKGLATGLGVAAAGFVGLAGAAVKAADDMAMTKHSFTALTGSAATAVKHIRELEQFGVNSTLNFEIAKEGSQNLLSMGFAAEQVMPILQAAGDTSAATGKGKEGFQSIIRALGEMKAKGTATTDTMNKMILAGLPSYDILAAKLGITVPEAMEKVKNKQLDLATTMEALVHGMGEKYAGAMANTQKEVGESIDAIKKTALIGLIEVGTKISDALNLKEFFANIASGMQTIVDTFRDGGLAAVIDRFVGPELKAALIGIGVALTAILLPGLVSVAIAAASALLPLLPIIAVSVAIAGAAYLIMKNWTPIKKFFVETFLAMKFWGMEALIAIGKAFVFLAETFLKGADKMFGWIPGIGDKLKLARDKVGELKDSLNDAKDNNLKKWQKDTDKLNASLNKVTKSAKETKKEMPKASDFKATTEGVKQVDAAFTDFQNNIKKIGDGVDDTMVDIIMGTKKASEALMDLGKQMAQLLIKMAVNKMITSLFPGMQMGSMPVKAFATGGIVTRPTFALIGERGPEMITPLSGPNAPKGVASAGAGSIKVQNNMYNQTSQPMQTETSVERKGDEIIISTFLKAIGNNTGGVRTAIQRITK